jgi:hypothetical protein
MKRFFLTLILLLASTMSLMADQQLDLGLRGICYQNHGK